MRPAKAAVRSAALAGVDGDSGRTCRGRCGAALPQRARRGRRQPGRRRRGCAERAEPDVHDDDDLHPAGGRPALRQLVKETPGRDVSFTDCWPKTPPVPSPGDAAVAVRRRRSSVARAAADRGARRRRCACPCARRARARTGGAARGGGPAGGTARGCPVIVRPRWSVNVRPSGVRGSPLTPRAPWWTARWQALHSVTRLSSSVLPPSSQCTMWWTSRYRRAPHHGTRQRPRSRCITSRRVRAGTMRCVAPTLTGRPPLVNTGESSPSHVRWSRMASGSQVPSGQLAGTGPVGSRKRLIRTRSRRAGVSPSSDRAATSTSASTSVARVPVSWRMRSRAALSAASRMRP